MEYWKIGMMEGWNIGIMGKWNNDKAQSDGGFGSLFNMLIIASL